jgi:hypothetical protein
MTVRGIGAAAQLEINRFGTGFVKRHSRVRPAPPMRPREAAATTHLQTVRGIPLPHVMDLAINGHRGPGFFYRLVALTTNSPTPAPGLFIPRRRGPPATRTMR